MGRACRTLLIILAALLPVSAFAQEPADKPCRQESAERFVIDGRTDQALLDCVKANFVLSTNELVVTSWGGDMAISLDIAAILERGEFDMVVEEVCASACANYFIPLARRLQLNPGAFVLLHGGADEVLFFRDFGTDSEYAAKLVEQEAGKLDRPTALRLAVEIRTQAQRLVDRQKAFARKHGISPGWLLYRSMEEPDRERDLSGELTPNMTYVLAEEAFVKSCLPNVVVEPFQQELEDRVLNRSRWLWRNRFAPSGDLVCLGRFEELE
jgi:hypothetical protein